MLRWRSPQTPPQLIHHNWRIKLSIENVLAVVYPQLYQGDNNTESFVLIMYLIKRFFMHKTDTRDDSVAKNKHMWDNKLLSKCQSSALFLVRNKRIIFLYGTKVSRKELPILTANVGVTIWILWTLEHVVSKIWKFISMSKRSSINLPLLAKKYWSHQNINSCS